MVYCWKFNDFFAVWREKISRKAAKNAKQNQRISGFHISLGHGHQVRRQPFLPNFIFLCCDSFCAVAPFFGGVVLAAGFFRIVFDLFGADNDSVSELVPILVLYVS